MFDTLFTIVFVDCSDIQIVTSTSVILIHIYIQLKIVTKYARQTMQCGNFMVLVLKFARKPSGFSK